MKNILKNMSYVSLGLALALGMSNTEVAASDDVTTDVQNESKVLSIEIPNVPIIGDVNVSIPAKKSEGAEMDNAVVSVEVTDGILDEVKVAVGAETKSDEGDTKQSLASVEVKSAITNDVNVDVASSEKSENSFDGGLIEVNAEDLPVIGETHVGVIDKHVAQQDDSEPVSTGLVQADIDGELLEDTSVNVISKETDEDAESNARKSAIVNVSNDGGVLEGVVDEANVSVLENKQSKTPDTDQSKDSIGSVGLTSPITNDVAVDVGLSDLKSDETSSTFDGGLVEVNAEDLLLLGETHVGLVDKHIHLDEESTSFSTGVGQVDLDGDLIKDTAIKVLAKDGELTEEGYVVTQGVLQTELGLLGSDTIPIDLITSQQIYPIANEDSVPPSIIVLIPVEDDDNTTPPTVIVPLPGEDESSVPPSVIVPVPGDDSSQGNNDESITTPNENDADAVEGSTDDQDGEDDSVFPPAVDNGSKNRHNIVQNSPKATDSLVGMESMIASGNRNTMNDNPLNRLIGQTELPTTGGLFDSKRLALLGLLLVAMGIVLRMFGKRPNYETQAS